MSERANQQLGMDQGTATTKLRRLVFFQLIQQAGRDNCYRCGLKIDSIDELNMDHKTPWLDAENAVELFFDLDNIAFSHAKCNRAARRKETYKVTEYETAKCHNCDASFTKKAKYFNYYRKRGKKNFYCSVSCSATYGNKLRTKDGP